LGYQGYLLCIASTSLSISLLSFTANRVNSFLSWSAMILLNMVCAADDIPESVHLEDHGINTSNS